MVADPHVNLLAQESSPYLLQHARNPVDWRPWGEPALNAARAQDKPILLSVGYAACHWCHVMAHESFENAETAALMNALFVCIKVDREERPDIDHLYMSALHALGEQGGWPLTMALTPDGAPFWGGTYFPPEPRWGRPSFRQVLHSLSDAWREQRERVLANGDGLRRALAQMSATRPGDVIAPADLDRAAADLLGRTDSKHGGLLGAPKFPNPPVFAFLWQNAFRTGDPAGRNAARLLLTRMSQGGIYDHLGGGYARYSTDAVWLAPHFEKMLYDNAQVLDLLALAHAAAPDQLYADRAEATVRWLDRDMTAASLDGHAAFSASEDADSEGEEGRFYVWSEVEIDGLLGPAAAAFKHAYDVTPEGNWEDATILRRVTPPGSPAEEAALAQARGRLFEARASRIRPGRDDKVLADWNGLAIAALCRASAVFRRPNWLARAASAFAFVLAALGADGGRVDHAWRLGRITARGLLDDQAAMARAALALFEATGEVGYLNRARALTEAAVAHFADGDGAYFITAADAPDVPLGPAARPRHAGDNATPSGTGVLAGVLARLFHLTGEPVWRARVEALLRAYGGFREQLSAMPSLLAAADVLEAATTVVIVGDLGDPAIVALRSVALASPDPATIVLSVVRTDALPTDHPATGKHAGAAYVCRRQVCGLPIAEPSRLAEALSQR